MRGQNKQKNREIPKGYRNLKKREKHGFQLSVYVYKKLERHLNRRKVRQQLRKLYVVSDEELDRLSEAYYVRYIRCILGILCAGLILGMICFIQEQRKDPRIVLERDTYGGEESELTVETEIDGKTQAFDVDVLPLTYDAQTIQAAFAQGFDYLDTVYLGENDTADSITEDLNLVDEIEDLGLSVSWDTGDTEYVSYKGEVVDGTLIQPVLVNLTATLSYEEYEASRLYPVRVAGKEKSVTAQIVDRIQSSVRTMQQDAKDSAKLILPEKVEGYVLKKPESIRRSMLIFVTGVLLSVGAGYEGKKKLWNKEKKRNEELLAAYPAFVDLLVLYMGAGLTVKGALERVIALGRCKILSEELRYTMNEIRAGIPETEAYYRLGNRLDLPVYHKMMTLLSQNIKKGTRDILNLLTEEETEALQLKREIAKRKGEEAGTKLLFPMILELMVVMMIVIAPALMGF